MAVMPLSGWTPETVKEHLDSRIEDMDKRYMQLSESNNREMKEMRRLIGELNAAVSGVVGTVGQRTGVISMVQKLVPNLISVCAIIALIFVSKNGG